MTNKTPKTDNKTPYEVQYTRRNGRKATRHNQTMEQIRALYNEFKTHGAMVIWNCDTLTSYRVRESGHGNVYETINWSKRNSQFRTIHGNGWAVCDYGNGSKFAFKIGSIATTNYVSVRWGC